MICAAWERGLALAVDLFLTALLTGAVAGLVWGDPRSAVSAHLTGVSILWAVLFSLYHGLMNSRPFRGHTFGKKLGHVCLIRGDGKFLPVKISIARSAGLAAMAALLGLAAEAALGPAWRTAGIPLVALLSLANFRTLRGPHDAAFGTYVVEAPYSLRLPAQSYLAAFVMLTLVAGASYRVGRVLGAPEPMPETSSEEIASWTPDQLEEKAKALVPAAELELGLRMMKGDRVAQDNKRGLELVQFAASQGYSTAQLVLGYLHIEWAKQDPRHTETALDWFRKAADQGNVKAQTVLGLMLASGRFGVKRDLDEALVWLHKAADQKDARAVQFLEALGKYYPQKLAEPAKAGFVDGFIVRFAEAARRLYHKMRRPAGESASPVGTEPPAAADSATPTDHTPAE